MIDPAQSTLPLHAFSHNWTQIQFDSINLQKPISDLTLPDLLWCLRKRIGQGLGIAGNFIAAEREITKLKTAILNQQNVFIESAWSTLCTEETLLNFITHEYSEYGYLLDDIKASIIREQKIKTVPIPPL